MPVIAVLYHNTPELHASIDRQLGEGYWAIDNGSEEGKRYRGKANVFTIWENKYFSGGWNVAMKWFELQNFDYIWMLNSDVDGLTWRTYNEISSLLSKNPDIAAITPAFNSPHRIFHQQTAKKGRPGIRNVPWIDWCCPVVSIAAWREIGQFDERFLGYGADIDWCLRAHRLKYRLGVCDARIVRHLGSRTVRATGNTVMHQCSEMDRVFQKKWNIEKISEYLRLSRVGEILT